MFQKPGLVGAVEVHAPTGEMHESPGLAGLRLPCFAAGPLGAGTQVLLSAYGSLTVQSLEVPEVHR